jgi:hypothetical protein
MSTLHPSDNTLISVIVPFGDPRGRAEHLDSWTQQTLAPERFEIIAVANPQRSNEAAIRERLRPHDRLLSINDPYPFPMYSVAAEAARGRSCFSPRITALPIRSVWKPRRGFLRTTPTRGRPFAGDTSITRPFRAWSNSLMTN